MPVETHSSCDDFPLPGLARSEYQEEKWGQPTFPKTTIAVPQHGYSNMLPEGVRKGPGRSSAFRCPARPSPHFGRSIPPIASARETVNESDEDLRKPPAGQSALRDFPSLWHHSTSP